MADVHSKEVRSYNMSRIKGKDTKPEMLVRKFLHANGFRYRLHVKDLSGKPDIVLPKYKTVIFVHGCFWNAHEGYKINRIPKNNQEYWIPKITGNVIRDKQHTLILKKMGWRIFYIWECELKNQTIKKTLTQLIKKLRLNLIVM